VAVMRIHIDTNIYSAALRGDRKVVDLLQSAASISISAIVIGELLTGFRLGSREKKNRSLLNRFLDSPRVEIVDITEEVAEHYAYLHLQLRRLGRPIPANDIWIAAAAMSQGTPLATLDAHFQYIPGLLLAPIK
jgi:predicted nucleic acid-binding protein